MQVQDLKTVTGSEFVLMMKQCGFSTLLNIASEKNNQNVSNILHIDRIDLHQSFPTDLLPDIEV